MTQLEGIAAVRRWLRGTNQDAVLWRAPWMFVALDAFFTGLVGAYAYAHANVAGVLVFIR